ncbi:hypothetical protein ACT17_05955 [Mycolicibacterium conceptionense]|uniref:Uncharacterized protein n=1 Tax=Mycolicibacterium conceptionense TaxID=451644 RepID=A0A0J8UDI4_9MYCO|nr:hypothetical protein [Mycolicibacterium conceptionense]KMV19593.1 hypothetical protein ACT17_05955 [Mycolicibacterium conceptionense]
MSAADPTVEAQAIEEAITEYLRGTFGGALRVLRDPEAFAQLMLGAGLGWRRTDARVNPNGTVTEVETLTVPTLVWVGCMNGQLAMVFENLLGLPATQWAAASETLRSGFRAATIETAEHTDGNIVVTLTG